jgi:cell division septal protein FtsQ
MTRTRTFRVGVALAILVAVGAGLWLIARDSSFFQVKKVQISGLDGPRAERVRIAARDQTTLHVDRQLLRDAAAGQPPIESMEVTTSIPDSMSIVFKLYRPVAAIGNGGAPAVAVTADGRLLKGIPTSGLPRISGQVQGDRVSGGETLTSLKLLASAPGSLLARVSQIRSQVHLGIVVILSNGPAIYFGDTTDLRAKWAAAASVLADPRTAGASYVDVRVARRPAVGGVQGGVAGGVNPADPNQPINAGDSGGSQPGTDQTTTDTSGGGASPN